MREAICTQLMVQKRARAGALAPQAWTPRSGRPSGKSLSPRPQARPCESYTAISAHTQWGYIKPAQLVETC